METPLPPEPKPWFWRFYSDLAARSLHALLFTTLAGLGNSLLHLGTGSGAVDNLRWLVSLFCFVLSFPTRDTFTIPAHWPLFARLGLHVAITAGICFCFTLAVTQNIVSASVHASYAPITLLIFEVIRLPANVFIPRSSHGDSPSV